MKIVGEHRIPGYFLSQLKIPLNLCVVNPKGKTLLGDLQGGFWPDNVFLAFRFTLNNVRRCLRSVVLAAVMRDIIYKRYETQGRFVVEKSAR